MRKVFFILIIFIGFVEVGWGNDLWGPGYHFLGEKITSTNGKYEATLTSDGYLVVNYLGEGREEIYAFPERGSGKTNGSAYLLIYNEDTKTRANTKRVHVGLYQVGIVPYTSSIKPNLSLYDSPLTLEDNDYVTLGLQIKNDGSLHLVRASTLADLWRSEGDQPTHPCSGFNYSSTANGTDRLVPGKMLFDGEELVSQNGKYKLKVGKTKTQLIRTSDGGALFETVTYSAGNRAFLTFDVSRRMVQSVTPGGTRPTAPSWGVSELINNVWWSHVTYYPALHLPWLRVMVKVPDPSVDRWKFGAGFGVKEANFHQDRSYVLNSFCYPRDYQALNAGFLAANNPFVNDAKSLLPTPGFNLAIMEQKILPLPDGTTRYAYTLKDTFVPAGMLLRNDGNLIIYNKYNATLWESKTGGAPSPSIPPRDFIAENTNLVYRGGTLIQTRGGYVSLHNSSVTQFDALTFVAKKYLLLTASGTGVTKLEAKGNGRIVLQNYTMVNSAPTIVLPQPPPDNSGARTSTDLLLADSMDSEPTPQDSSLLINAYPNPTTGLVQFSFENPNEQIGLIEVVDQNGSVVSQGNNVQQIDLGGLAQGVYYYRVFSNKRRYAGKIIKR